MAWTAGPASARAGTQVFFSPGDNPTAVIVREHYRWEARKVPTGDNPTAVIVRELEATKTSILVQAYSFTSAPIAKAVVDAHRRGVKATVILDRSQRTEKYSSADFLKNSGVPTLIDATHAIAHNKIMILDARKVITGSFNFTKSAE